EEASVRILIRDFELEGNERRMNYLKTLNDLFENRYPGLKIDLHFKHQYENMLRYVEKEQKVINLAKKAIELAGLEVKINSIRGGTDGASLSANGIPTPNIFTGGELFHSRKEFIPTLALQKAIETIIHLAELWTK
ncbi:MAG: peptidase T, partial [Promethearchaeota archaeon]